MGSLTAKYSEIVKFASYCNGEYKTLFGYANEACKDISDMLKRVQWSLDKVNEQLLLARRLLDEINVKTSVYRSQMEEAARRVAICRDRIDYIVSHPVTRTYTDNDGETHSVSEVDEAALSSARRELEYAESTYRMYREKFAQVESLRQEVIAWVNKLEILQRAIDSVAQAVQQDLYQANKFTDAIRDECNHNLKKLQAVIGSVENYLASKPIYIPQIKGVSGNYASSGGSSSYSYGNSGGTWQGLSYNQTDPGKPLSGAEKSKKSKDGKDVSLTYQQVSRAKEVSDEYFVKQSKRDISKLSGKEIEDVKIYLNNTDEPPAYAKINGHLCEGKEISESLSNTIDVMTDAISKCKLRRDTILYRGIKVGKVKTIFGDLSGKSTEDLNREFSGRLFANKGFMSTSIKENDALGYSGPGGALFIIEAPCGAEGIYTSGIAKFEKTEHEVLLQRGSVFKINRMVKDGDLYIIRMTLGWRQKIDERK